MQRLAEVCIRRPVFAAMLILALVVVGATAYFELGIDRYPAVDIPQVRVRATLPGAAPTDMETEVAQRQFSAKQDGWAITYQVSTPTKASFSGKQGGQILYTRMVAVCGGSHFAAFELTYGSASIPIYGPIVDRLVASLKPAAAGRC